MTSIAIILWITAYTASIIVCAFGFYLWISNKDRRVLGLVMILITMTITSLVSLIVPLIVGYGRLFFTLLLQVTALYFLVVPFFINECSGTRFTKQLIYYFVSALIIINLTNLFSDYLAFILIIPIGILPALFPKQHQKATWPGIKPKPVGFWQNINHIGLVCFLVVSAGSMLFLLLLISPMSNYTTLVQSWYAIVTLVYLVFPALYFRYSITTRRPASKRLLRTILSPRETEVAEMIISGKTYQETADRLFVSLSAIKKHANNIYRKTGTRNARELAARHTTDSPEPHRGH